MNFGRFKILKVRFLKKTKTGYIILVKLLERKSSLQKYPKSDLFCREANKKTASLPQHRFSSFFTTIPLSRLMPWSINLSTSSGASLDLLDAHQILLSIFEAWCIECSMDKIHRNIFLYSFLSTQILIFV